jgi:hypothetical protein
MSGPACACKMRRRSRPAIAGWPQHQSATAFLGLYDGLPRPSRVQAYDGLPRPSSVQVYDGLPRPSSYQVGLGMAAYCKTPPAAPHRHRPQRVVVEVAKTQCGCGTPGTSVCDCTASGSQRRSKRTNCPSQPTSGPRRTVLFNGQGHIDGVAVVRLARLRVASRGIDSQQRSRN